MDGGREGGGDESSLIWQPGRFTAGTAEQDWSGVWVRVEGGRGIFTHLAPLKFHRASLQSTTNRVCVWVGEGRVGEGS